MGLTIKHVEANGRERTFQVESVERTPEGELVFGTTEKITTGRAFIMNDAGKTVATYDFDKQKEQK